MIGPNLRHFKSSSKYKQIQLLHNKTGISKPSSVTQRESFNWTCLCADERPSSFARTNLHISSNYTTLSSSRPCLLQFKYLRANTENESANALYKSRKTSNEGRTTRFRFTIASGVGPKTDASVQRNLNYIYLACMLYCELFWNWLIRMCSILILFFK